MLSATKRTGLQYTDYAASKHELGMELNRVPNCVKGNYSFAVQGGAVGDVTLLDDNGQPVKIPSGALVRNVAVVVDTTLTAAGAATLDLNLQSANDLVVAADFDDWNAGVKVQGIPDFATVADQILLSAERTLTLSINSNALTAGIFRVFVDYVF